MLVQNADGSVPEMCGNGARCAALWIATEGGTKAATATVPLMTDAGPRPCKVQASSGAAGMVEVEMGKAVLEAPRALAGFEGVPVSMGNPHRVIFSGGDISRLAREQGPALCAAEHANIEFVERLGPQRYAAAVFERGAGLTQACGTGACAVAAAAVARGEAKRDEEIEVQLPGGSLFLRVGQDGHVLMRGPARLVFAGGDWLETRHGFVGEALCEALAQPLFRGARAADQGDVAGRRLPARGAADGRGRAELRAGGGRRRQAGAGWSEPMPLAGGKRRSGSGRGRAAISPGTRPCCSGPSRCRPRFPSPSS